ncbi:MAG: FecR domain-containing protein [Bacteroidales bacterium]|nr:FecR domain-containing protein [Candidatus Cryptobacteroides aphodequi]
MNSKTQKSLLNVLTRQSTGDDILLVSKWLEEDPANMDEFDKVNAYWNSDVKPAGEYPGTEEVYRKIVRKHKCRLRTPMMMSALVVASVLLTLCLSPSKIVDHNSYTVITGESIANTILPDGTSVSLNRNSRLEYDESFIGGPNRMVRLEGEAYFDVVHDTEHPFIVNMDACSATVLGTSFDALNAGNSVSITLEEGSVELRCGDHNVTLRPGQQAVFSKSDCAMDIASVNTSSVCAWKDHLIRVTSRPLRDLLSMIESYFGVNIIIKDNLAVADKVITAAFDGNSSVGEILSVLRNSAEFQWKQIDNKTFIIY